MLKHNLLTEKSRYFLLFFSVFTGIFFVLSLIILQILSAGTYTSVDTQLVKASQSADSYADLSIDRWNFIKESDILVKRIRTDREQIPDKLLGIDVLLYNKHGGMYNTIDAHSEFYDVPLKTTNLGRIISGEIKTDYGQTKRYRLLTTEVFNKDYPNVKYATFVVGTDQLEESKLRTERIIISVLILFWLLSSITSMYLANWTRRPILESYEKQKAFVENASHELKTPLAVLQNRLETLFRRPESTVLENSENIASSLEEVRNMNILTKNLLNLARRDEGLSPSYSTIEPKFFNEVFDNYRLIAKESNKEFLGNNLLNTSIYSDRDLLKQLMTILFDNAINYTGEEGRIEVTIRSTEKYLVLTVSDNGIGISDEHKTKVFDRFYRVDKARTRQKGGFGLGLALAQQIVTALKGTISISDNLPKGTIFKIKI